MVLLESSPLPSLTTLPHFDLNDSFGKSFTSHEIMGKKGMLIVFTCNHCPYAIAIWKRLIELYPKIQTDIGMIAINPNIHPDYPQDSVESMQQKVLQDKIPFPYLVDDQQLIAKQYQAQCTPDIYLVTNTMKLFYHGRFDDNWQEPDKVQHQDLFNATNRLIQSQTPPKDQFPSIGCSIKWLD